MFEMHSPDKERHIQEKDLNQQVEHMHVPNRTRRGVWMSRHAKSVAIVLWKPLISRYKVEFGIKVTNLYNWLVGWLWFNVTFSDISAI